MTEESLTPTKFDFFERTETKEEEKVWCKIGPDGNLELFEWEYVEKLAQEFDNLGQIAQKSNAHLICKLAVLIRKQTLEKAADLMLKYKDSPADATTVMFKDPLEEV